MRDVWLPSSGMKRERKNGMPFSTKKGNFTQPLGIKVMILWSISEISIILLLLLQWLFFCSVFLQCFHESISFNFPTSTSTPIYQYISSSYKTLLSCEEPIWLEQISFYSSKSKNNCMNQTQPIRVTFLPVCIIGRKAYNPKKIGVLS